MTNEQTNLSKGRKIAAWILVGLIGALLIMGGTMKLTGGQQAADNFAKYGLEGREMLIGMGELIAAILFLIPRTSSLGILLVTAHLGGAMQRIWNTVNHLYPLPSSCCLHGLPTGCAIRKCWLLLLRSRATLRKSAKTSAQICEK